MNLLGSDVGGLCEAGFGTSVDIVLMCDIFNRRSCLKRTEILPYKFPRELLSIVAMQSCRAMRCEVGGKCGNARLALTRVLTVGVETTTFWEMNEIGTLVKPTTSETRLADSKIKV